MKKEAIEALVKTIGDSATGPVDKRTRDIVDRIVCDLFKTIEDLDIQPSEFWSALSYLGEAGVSGELGLIAAGLGFEHFLDLRMDEAEANAGVEGATPRTIEGPLYVAGAPETTGFARLDAIDEPGETIVMRGRVLDENARPIAGALVEVWHANHLGNYSHFDRSQPAFNLRRSIRTDADGRYAFRSVMPVGYSVPPNGATEQLLNRLGRHGHRPAHIHFFVSAPGHRKLTTQINIDGDPHLWDDFAFATRQGLVPALKPQAAGEGNDYDIAGPFVLIDFDFRMARDREALPTTEIQRLRATA